VDQLGTLDQQVLPASLGNKERRVIEDNLVLLVLKATKEREVKQDSVGHLDFLVQVDLLVLLEIKESKDNEDKLGLVDPQGNLANWVIRVILVQLVRREKQALKVFKD